MILFHGKRHKTGLDLKKMKRRRGNSSQDVLWENGITFWKMIGKRSKHASSIGVFTDCDFDPIMVCKNESTFNLRCMAKTQLSLPIPTPCFKVGTSWASNLYAFKSGLNRQGSLRGSSMKSALLKPLEGRKKKQEVGFYYGKRACLA